VSQCITSKVLVHQPMSWPSFMGLRADGDKARPRPWPSFKVIYDGESPGDAIMKPSPQCTSDNSRAKSGATMEFPLLAFYGRSASLYVQPSSAILSACGPGYFVIGRLMHVTTACSIWQLFLSSSSLIFTWVTFLKCSRELSGMLLYSFELSRAKLVGMLHEFENRWSYMEKLQLLVLTWASEHEAVRSGFQFQCIILDDWHLHNQSMLATMLLFYSLKYHLWADKWRPRFVRLWHAYASLVWLLYNISGLQLASVHGLELKFIVK
jgi:hypothetical protein